MMPLAECTHHCTMLRDYTGLLTDVPHIAFEFTLTLIQDVLIGLLLWPVIKRVIANRRQQAHQEFDEQHHIRHEAQEGQMYDDDIHGALAALDRMAEQAQAAGDTDTLADLSETHDALQRLITIEPLVPTDVPLNQVQQQLVSEPVE